MTIYVLNTPAKFHPNPIWSDGELGFLQPSRRRRTKRTS